MTQVGIDTVLYEDISPHLAESSGKSSGQWRRGYIVSRIMQDRGGCLQSRYILSYGGGVNTTALMVLLIKKKMPFDEAVFADTGAELPETYENIKMAKAYLKEHGICFRTVRSRNGTLYDTCKRRKVIPSRIWRWSTRDYKITPIHAYYRSLKCHIYEYLGIAYDEIERMKPSKEPYITSLFPLVEEKIDRAGCIELIRSAGLPVPPKSGCYFCPFNTVERWREIWMNHRRLYLKAVWLEEHSKHFPSQKLNKTPLRVLKDIGFDEDNSTLSDKPCGAYCMV